MQTFLPVPSFTRTARMLDRQRLGKQRVEAWQILRALRGETKGWRNHPATRMWRGYEPCLIEYAIAICREWIARGYQDQMLARFMDERARPEDVELPPWIGDRALHASHRSALLRKDPEHYGQHGWTDDPEDPYVWPLGQEVAR